jgi:hypothetical protein
MKSHLPVVPISPSLATLVMVAASTSWFEAMQKQSKKPVSDS